MTNVHPTQSFQSAIFELKNLSKKSNRKREIVFQAQNNKAHNKSPSIRRELTRIDSYVSQKLRNERMEWESNTCSNDPLVNAKSIWAPVAGTIPGTS
jgi:hypothetical protein